MAESIASVTPIKPGEIVERTLKNNYTDSTGAKATVPKGFTVSGVASEQTISGGLVIYDIPDSDISDTSKVNWNTDAGKEAIRQNYNQWVWIPVPNPSDMYQEVTGT